MMFFLIFASTGLWGPGRDPVSIGTATGVVAKGRLPIGKAQVRLEITLRILKVKTYLLKLWDGK